MVNLPLHAEAMITGDRLLERGPLRDIRKRINQLQDEIKALRISEGVNYRVKHTACGQMLQIGKTAEETETVTGMVFRGEWSASETYETNDVVVVRGGLTGGTYIAILDVPIGSAPIDPPVKPEDGIYWVCLSRDNAAGVW